MRNSVSVIPRRPLTLLGFIQVSEACEAFRKGERSLVLSFLGMASSTGWHSFMISLPQLCPDAVEAGPVPLRASFLWTTDSDTGIQPRSLSHWSHSRVVVTRLPFLGQSPPSVLWTHHARAASLPLCSSSEPCPSAAERGCPNMIFVYLEA